MIIALNQREPLLAASCHEHWFHTFLDAFEVIVGFKIFLTATDNAAIVPGRKIKSYESVDQRLTLIDRKIPPAILIRLRDEGVPFSGRNLERADMSALSSGDMSPHSKNPVIAGVVITLLRLCRRADSSASMNRRALQQFDGSKEGQSPSRRAWS